MIKKYFEHEAARFMRHPVLWTIYTAGVITAYGVFAFREMKYTRELDRQTEVLRHINSSK